MAGGIFLAVMLNLVMQLPETGWLAGLAQIGLSGLTLFVRYCYIAAHCRQTRYPKIAYLAKEMGAGFLGGMAAMCRRCGKGTEENQASMIYLVYIRPIFIWSLWWVPVTGGKVARWESADPLPPL